MGGFFYENVSNRIWDGVTWDGMADYNCWRNVNGSEIRNCQIINTKLKTSTSHGEGFKVDLSTNSKVYRTFFKNNDIMHMFFSYPFWGSSLNGVSHGAYTNNFLVEECGFDDLGSSFGLPKYFHIQIGGNSSSNYVRNVVFKNCFALEGIAFMGGTAAQMAGVKVENLMWVPRGSDVKQYMANYANQNPPPPPPPEEPPPPPVLTVEERLVKLESDSSTAKANIVGLQSDLGILTTKVAQAATKAELEDALQDYAVRLAQAETAIQGKASKPEAVNVAAVKAVIDKIRAGNPKIAASDDAVLAALVKAVNEARA